MTERRHLRGRILRGFFAAAALSSAIAFASPAPAGLEQVHQVGSMPVNLPAGAAASDSNGSLILNPVTRTGFQVLEMETEELFRLRIFDLDTLKTRFELPLGVTLSAYRSLPAEYTHALDNDRNWLYLPYQGPPAETGLGIIVIDGSTGKIVRNFDRLKANDPTAVMTIDEEGQPHPCTAASCQPQTFGRQPVIAAMDFVPSFIAGGLPKILMLWQDPLVVPLSELNASLTWLTQWDADTGRQDYSYRISSCQYRGLPYSTSSTLPLAVFQARIGSGIYLGCNASGGAGLVVRITLDTNGRPSAEDSFPGPNNVADIASDPEDDRLILRVVNEEGESYWIFNGQASSYSGVIGATVAGAATALGVDRDNGRLYMLTPPTVAGRQTSPGGLLMSDIRRSPAPQGLAFPQFSMKGFQRISVDPRGPGGARRLFVLPPNGKAFMILQDDVAITGDPLLTDLDRFTTDVDEQKGVTDVNFTSTGHAYGMRTLLTGGLEGVPPGGPDASGIRVGRYVPRMLGSPCGTGDRALIIGSVPATQYSNNIFSARAIASETDAGTRTDVGEPTGRCWPRPGSVPYVDDPFFAVFQQQFPRPLDGDTRHADDVEDATMPEDSPTGTGRSDADELVGNDLPFGPAECSTEGEVSSRTRAHMLDRRGVPKEHRGKTQDLQGYRAEVNCAPSKGFVSAVSDAAAFEQRDIAAIPGPDKKTPGFIRVADVSSEVRLFRDPKKGLVARTIAYARGINIADRIYIDLAITTADAFAAGRPGTAGATFTRQLCGVRIPEAKIHGDYVQQDVPPFHVGDPVEDTTAPYDPENQIAGADLGDVDPLDKNTDDIDINGISQELCGDPGVAQAGTQPVIDAINKVLGSRGKASSPSPDPELRQGSEGGYLASIQKDRLQQVGSRAVNQDDSTQVPALELIIFNDDANLGRGRQIYQFAGVDASVSYGIYLLNGGGDFIDLPEVLIDYTGPVVSPDPYVPPVATGPVAPRALGPITYLFEATRYVLRSPRDALLGALVWMILLSPVQMMSRRRALRAGA